MMAIVRDFIINLLSLFKDFPWLYMELIKELSDEPIIREELLLMQLLQELIEKKELPYDFVEDRTEILFILLLFLLNDPLKLPVLIKENLIALDKLAKKCGFSAERIGFELNEELILTYKDLRNICDELLKQRNELISFIKTILVAGEYIEEFRHFVKNRGFSFEYVFAQDPPASINPKDLRNLLSLLINQLRNYLKRLSTYSQQQNICGQWYQAYVFFKNILDIIENQPHHKHVNVKLSLDLKGLLSKTNVVGFPLYPVVIRKSINNVFDAFQEYQKKYSYFVITVNGKKIYALLNVPLPRRRDSAYGEIMHCPDISLLIEKAHGRYKMVVGCVKEVKYRRIKSLSRSALIWEIIGYSTELTSNKSRLEIMRELNEYSSIITNTWIDIPEKDLEHLREKLINIEIVPI